MLTSGQQSHLRRAKSTSSARTTFTASSSQPHRSIWTTSTDPISSKQNAEAAAIEAYQRAQEEASRRAVMSSSAQMQRRRSQRKGRSEGSHLEDALLGRRRSTRMSRKDASVEKDAAQSSQAKRSTVGLDAITRDGYDDQVRGLEGEGRPPASHDFAIASSSEQQKRRRTRTGVHDDHQSNQIFTSTRLESRPNVQRPLPESRLGHGDTKLVQGGQGLMMEDSTCLSIAYSEKRASIRETQTDEEIMAMARDRCLQDFSAKPLHERRSGILRTFGKRRATTNTPAQVAPETSSSSVLVDESLTLPLPTRPPPPIPVFLEPSSAKTQSRNFSVTLRGRFMKAFRKTSKTMPAETTIPPQHVEAKDFRWTVKDYDLEASTSAVDVASGAHSIANADRLTLEQSLSSRVRPVYSPAQKNSSNSQVSTAKSRVTSWTNSTIAGASTLRLNHLPHEEEADVAEEYERPATAPALPPPPKLEEPRIRKVSSFFGRPIHNRLRKTSKADMRESSEQSKGLYDALQKRIRPMRSTNLAIAVNPEGHGDSAIAAPPFTRAMLPSQSRQSLRDDPAEYASSIGTIGRRAPTVHTVTPEPTTIAHTFIGDTFSPIQEVASPMEADHRSDSRADVVRPTRQQLLRRMQRAKNRWRDPLDDGDRGTPRSTKGARVEGLADDLSGENPYTLSNHHPYDHKLEAQQRYDLPHHTRVSPAFNAFDDHSLHDKHSFLSPEYPPPPPPPAFVDRTPPRKLYNPSIRNGQLRTYLRYVDSPSANSVRLSPSPTNHPRTDPLHEGERALMSPSIYSRATDGASVRVLSPVASPEVSQWRKYGTAEDNERTPTAKSTARTVERKDSRNTIKAPIVSFDTRAESGDDADALGGTMITVTGREVKRYRVPFSKPKVATALTDLSPSAEQTSSKLSKHKVLTTSRKPSMEWRRWLSNELNIFRFGSGSKEGGDESRKVSATSDLSPEPADRDHTADIHSTDVHVIGETRSTRASPRSPTDDAVPAGPTISSAAVVKPDEDSLQRSQNAPRPHVRSRATSRSSSSGYMNERYPIVATALAIGTAASITETRRKGPKKAASFAGRTTSAEPVVPEITLPDQDDALIEPTEDAVQVEGSKIEEVKSQTNNAAVAPSTKLTVRPISGFRPRSALELRVKYNTGAGEVSKPLEVRKTRQALAALTPASNDVVVDNTEHSHYPVTEEIPGSRMLQVNGGPPGTYLGQHPLRLEEDPTLINISAGPYAYDRGYDADADTAGHGSNVLTESLAFGTAGVMADMGEGQESAQDCGVHSLGNQSSPRADGTDDQSKRSKFERKPVPNGSMIARSHYQVHPQRSKQQTAAHGALGTPLESVSSAAWLTGDARAAGTSIDPRTTEKPNPSIGENTPPPNIRVSKQASRSNTKPPTSHAKISGQHPEDPKERSPSIANPRCHRHRQRTAARTAPRGLA